MYQVKCFLNKPFPTIFARIGKYDELTNAVRIRTETFPRQSLFIRIIATTFTLHMAGFIQVYHLFYILDMWLNEEYAIHLLSGR